MQPACGVRAKQIGFFFPRLQRELWTSWVHAAGRTVVYLSLYATPEDIMFTCSLAEL